MDIDEIIWQYIEAAKRICENHWRARNALEDIRVYPGCVEPGYEDQIMVLGDWNRIEGYGPRERVLPIKVDRIMERLNKSLERLEEFGIRTDWDDEWDACEDCNKCFRTSGNSYFWVPSFYQNEHGSRFCLNCIDWSEVVEECQGTTKGWVYEKHHLEDLGYVQIKDGFESGWHPGQTDDPQKVADRMDKAGCRSYIFVLDEQSQFYSRWSVWAKKEDFEGEPEVWKEALDV